ncbi:MAG TPA: urease accessory protein UreD [Burkholderiaceae bacterium]|nr:urease accessory protein UreD [Burkholderiaceae bacterium]
MTWQGRLELAYRRSGDPGHDRTLLHDRHDGPLRVLKSLYPEAPQICHSVLVHPPGGIVGGDVLEVDVALAAHAHALITTPGATRFYRSLGAPALQDVSARIADGARLEWLPLETLAYSGCLAETRMRFELAPAAEMMGWDVLALGLPAADQAFERGRYTQTIELPGCWLERGHLHADDTRLLDSPLGWDRQRVLATLWFAAGSELARERRETLLDAARAAIGDAAAGGDAALQARSGVTAPNERIVVLRALAARVEPAMRLLTAVWARWREAAWALPACMPRVWRT